jgi:hypothetical protein
MYWTARRVTIAMALALCALIGAVPVALGAPSTTRAHFEFEVRVDDCGIGTLDVSIDVVSTTKETDNKIMFNVVDTGTAIDSATGTRYQLVDRFTQAFVVTQGVIVQVAERTFLLVGPSGGIVSRGLVQFTIRPNASISDFDLQFVECHPR